MLPNPLEISAFWVFAMIMTKGLPKEQECLKDTGSQPTAQSFCFSWYRVITNVSILKTPQVISCSTWVEKWLLHYSNLPILVDLIRSFQVEMAQQPIVYENVHMKAPSFPNSKVQHMSVPLILATAEGSGVLWKEESTKEGVKNSSWLHDWILPLTSVLK